MQRFFYKNSIKEFLLQSSNEILGILAKENHYGLESTQRDAWIEQIFILKEILFDLDGMLFFEFSIPRMGKRVDVLLIIRHVIFVLEFKAGEKIFSLAAIEQVWDYALDLKNFHQTSHHQKLVPVLIPTKAKDPGPIAIFSQNQDNVLNPIKAIPESLRCVFVSVLDWEDGEPIEPEEWLKGRYLPTPTIIEAAKALYSRHNVQEIMKREADAQNLGVTKDAITKIIDEAKTTQSKAICFVTGVPGAGKTLVGLDIATSNMDKERGTSSVFLSGNGPLVDILREALTRDKYTREKELEKRVRKGDVFSRVKAFVQNVHHFRRDNLEDRIHPPNEHVAIFDEAQRAWNKEQTSKFVKSRLGIADFNQSEAEFLISCLNRHSDWATIVCLVGGGQELNTGEEGISAWLEAMVKAFPEWNVFISSCLTDSEYAAGNAIQMLKGRSNICFLDALHLSVSMRSFRAEHLSTFIKQLLDRHSDAAHQTYQQIKQAYPLVITRDLQKAKAWLKKQARGTERYGMLVSSKALRLKPLSIDVRLAIDHVQWFLNDKNDVRSSYFLEDAATEYKVQGLELDWACVIWDADFRYTKNGWGTYTLMHSEKKGTYWGNIHQEIRKQYLKNAYRVLLTRARQGMVIVVPEGSDDDHTRKR
jgi:DUF2075 family protein